MRIPHKVHVVGVYSFYHQRYLWHVKSYYPAGLILAIYINFSNAIAYAGSKNRWSPAPPTAPSVGPNQGT